MSDKGCAAPPRSVFTKPVVAGVLLASAVSLLLLFFSQVSDMQTVADFTLSSTASSASPPSRITYGFTVGGEERTPTKTASSSKAEAPKMKESEGSTKGEAPDVPIPEAHPSGALVYSFGPEYIDVATVETRTTKPPLILRFALGTMEIGLPGRFFWIGKGAEWKGFDTKIVLLHEFLRKFTESEGYDPRRPMIFVDGGDVLFLGCRLDFAGWLKSLGHPLVFGGEWECFETVDPPGCQVPTPPPTRRLPPIDKSLVRCGSICSTPPEPVFLNSGVFMGYPPDLLHMTAACKKKFQACVRDNSHDTGACGTLKNPTKLGDQRIYNWYRFREEAARSVDVPHGITLDYTQTLAINLWRMEPGFDQLFQPSNQRLKNTWSGAEVCFVHMSAGAKRLKKRLSRLAQNTLNVINP